MLHKLKGVFATLKKNDVRYMVIGGIAAIMHGVPRLTFDLDILIDPSLENAERLLKAFFEAGYYTAELTDAAQILKNEVSIFNDIQRIDVQTRTPGIEFEVAWARRSEMEIEGQKFYVLGLQDLINSKRAAGRPQDMEDVRLLETQDH